MGVGQASLMAQIMALGGKNARVVVTNVHQTRCGKPRSP
jgi:hypothetical protein